MKKLRIALIGLGKIAQKVYLPLVTNHPEVAPMLCTRNEAVLQSLASQYRIQEAYTNIQELIQMNPDAVMIHSATEGHSSLVSQFLQANIPVFVDKPLCYTLNECELLLDLSTQNQSLLYVGFNRRFAPLVQQLTKHPKPTQIYWQKNRVNLPGDPRTFVFDDFIHVVDSLRFLANGSVKNLRVFPKIKNNLLSAIQVIWDQKGTTLHGSMNRLSGITEERLEYYTEENKWTIDDLSSGIHYTNDQQYPIANDTWNTTLYKRGFEGLFKDWLQALRSKTFDSVRNNDIWQTHNLCETIVSKIEAQQ